MLAARAVRQNAEGIISSGSEMTMRPPTADEIRLAHAQVKQMVLNSGSSFLLAMRLLSRTQRQAMYAIYAFAHAVDDIADGSALVDRKLQDLSDWRAEIEGLYAGYPTHSITIALHDAVCSYALGQAEFMTLLDAMVMDAHASLYTPDWETLRQYCYQVAGTVGLLSIRVFGAEGAMARRFALALGEAFQLTNILRDLKEDALRGRLYLPAEYLLEHSIDLANAPEDILLHPNIGAVCAELAGRARESFAAADRALESCERGRLRPALLMMGIYEHILDRLERQGWSAILTRAPFQMSAFEKLSGAIVQGILRS